MSVAKLTRASNSASFQYPTVSPRMRYVYYGMFEARKKEDPRPSVDLYIALHVAEWFYATRIFQETGQAKDSVRLFEIEEEKDIRFTF